MPFPSVNFDEEADVLYVHLAAGEVAETTALGDLRMVDRAADGTILGIEFISASAGIDLRDVPLAGVVSQAIGDSGYTIRVYA